MSQDAFGNYIADLQSLAQAPAISTGATGRGHGPPDADTPLYLMAYIDEDTGKVYANVDGTVTGWEEITSNVSGVTGVYTSAADPNGVVEATGPAYCIGTGAFEGYYWSKVSAGTSNAQWNPV